MCMRRIAATSVPHGAESSREAVVSSLGTVINRDVREGKQNHT